MKIDVHARDLLKHPTLLAPRRRGKETYLGIEFRAGLLNETTIRLWAIPTTQVSNARSVYQLRNALQVGADELTAWAKVHLAHHATESVQSPVKEGSKNGKSNVRRDSNRRKR